VFKTLLASSTLVHFCLQAVPNRGETFKNIFLQTY